MTRALYEWLLWLHPPAFRRQFAAEMLWIFDEASESEGVVALLLDGLVSMIPSGSPPVRPGCVVASMRLCVQAPPGTDIYVASLTRAIGRNERPPSRDSVNAMSRKSPG